MAGLYHPAETGSAGTLRGRGKIFCHDHLPTRLFMELFLSETYYFRRRVNNYNFHVGPSIPKLLDYTQRHDN